jgi:hypothetical protein
MAAAVAPRLVPRPPQVASVGKVETRPPTPPTPPAHESPSSQDENGERMSSRDGAAFLSCLKWQHNGLSRWDPRGRCVLCEGVDTCATTPLAACAAVAPTCTCFSALLDCYAGLARGAAVPAGTAALCQQACETPQLFLFFVCAVLAAPRGHVASVPVDAPSPLRRPQLCCAAVVILGAGAAAATTAAAQSMFAAICACSVA